MYLTKGSLGALFGASDVVNAEIAKIMPVFLVSVPFVAVLHNMPKYEKSRNIILKQLLLTLYFQPNP